MGEVVDWQGESLDSAPERRPFAMLSNLLGTERPRSGVSQSPRCMHRHSGEKGTQSWRQGTHSSFLPSQFLHP